MAAPNPLRVAVSILQSLLRVAPPRLEGHAPLDHSGLAGSLSALATGPTQALLEVQSSLAAYLSQMESVSPDTLAPEHAKAFWINIYNVGALRLAGTALATGRDSVLRIPGGFRTPFATIDGERLSLDDVEHGKVRRFGDPRVHAALVCGSASCPTLRRTPYEGAGLDEQLDDQMRAFLAGGGAVPDSAARVIHLSRVFNWYGSDFVRPQRMPTFVPSRPRRTLASIRPWLAGEAAGLADRGARVVYQAYDWGLRCSVA